MQNLLSKITIHVNEKCYLKDPETSVLGKKILEGGIDMIEELGFEHFTFRKLAAKIESTEASIYRYFESKHKLLIYLTSWFWGWMEYKLVFSTANIQSPYKKLEKAIDLLTEEQKEDLTFSHVNEVKLGKIVVSESSKAYLTKEVDDENKVGAFEAYKKLVARVSDIILEIRPDYKYSRMLVSTFIEGAHLQRYYSEHLPRLTDKVKGEDAIMEFYKDMIFKAIKA